MATIEDDILGHIERHSVEGIRAMLQQGLDARAPVRGRSLTTWLTGMYTRSDSFAPCLKLLLDHGGTIDDPAILPVLLNDADTLAEAIDENPDLPAHRTSITCAFTPLVGVTPLHVAAEFGHADAASVLIRAGADINATAARDRFGLGGQTPLFHTVNSNRNRSEPVMRLLLDAGARVDVRLDGLTWGAGFEWETTLFDVTPVSYAQAGLLPQMHRDERDVRETVRALLAAAGRPVPPMDNVPNRYVAGSG